MFLMRIASITFLLGWLPSHTDTEKQLWMGSQVGHSKHSRGYAIQRDFFSDRSRRFLYTNISWNHQCDAFEFRYSFPSTACSNYFVQCDGFANPESEKLGVVNAILAWVWPILLGLFVNTNTLILLNLPAYHRGRALHILHGLSDDDDSQSQLKAWEQLIRPLMEEWKIVCVLATLTFGAALAMFQIPSFNNNFIIPALAYLTLIFTTTAILLSSIVIIHLGGETRDPVFIQTWLEVCLRTKLPVVSSPRLFMLQNFRSTDHRSLWGAWIIVSLPSVWTVWGSLSFFSSVVFLFWSGSGATAIGTADTAMGSSLTASNSAMSLEPSTDIPSLLTAIALLGFFNILGVVFSFWKQGRRQSTVLEAA
ncbi:hypothetical protein K443DRAFT_310115 [Laccaria amethystina LaAM-08-1]|uniref:Uncharacterized protein n=1 Tax=Laccaria amethystina LaAM-08-1 TaxID=1095629 RepID=A0A0C9XWZ2_9AGAR|nr:hypothetical protein K443DRAFT_310115 [Laccaria amethystina LaAM-08-1]